MARCPKCRSSRVHRSQSWNQKDSRRRVFAVWLRCHRCSCTFRGVDWGRVGLAFAAAAVVAAASWALRRDAPTAPPRALPSESITLAAPGPTGGEAALPDAALADAAAGGDNSARRRLGLARLQEFRVTGRQAALADALRWLKAAAEGGDPQAQLQLGTMYQEGSGLIEDYEEAARWLREAAQRGVTDAMVRLGGMSLAGEGVSKDPVEAYVWLNLAAARGERSAETARDRVRALLDAGQLAEAQSRSRILDREVPWP